MRYCPSCQEQYADSQVFCSNDGMRLETSQVVPQATSLRQCRACGESLEPGENFCAECGAENRRVTDLKNPQAGAIPEFQKQEPTFNKDSQQDRDKPRGVQKLKDGIKPIYLIGGTIAAGLIVSILFMPRLVRLFIPDSLVARLISTPLPKDSYQGWRPDKPEISQDKQPDEGQVGMVMASLTRAGGRDLGGFVFNVFQTPGQARISYDETTMSDRQGFQAQGVNVITPAGITGSCLGKGGKIFVCRALVGRTVVSVLFTGGESEQTAVASARALVHHVSALDR